jgi:hypothetical protein
LNRKRTPLTKSRGEQPVSVAGILDPSLGRAFRTCKSKGDEKNLNSRKNLKPLLQWSIVVLRDRVGR